MIYKSLRSHFERPYLTDLPPDFHIFAILISPPCNISGGGYASYRKNVADIIIL